MVIGDMLYILKHFNLNFILFLELNTVVFHNYCPTSPSRLATAKTLNYFERKRLTNENGNCVVFKNIIEFLVNIGNHLVV